MTDVRVIYTVYIYIYIYIYNKYIYIYVYIYIFNTLVAEAVRLLLGPHLQQVLPTGGGRGVLGYDLIAAE